MNIIPKTRYTGFIAMIILFLILGIGIFTLVNGYDNEQRLIKRGFVTLKLHGMSIQSKINVYATLVRNGQTPVKKSTLWDANGYDIHIDSSKNTWFIPDSSKIKRTHYSTSASGFFSEIMSGSFFDEYVVFKDSLLFYKSFDANLPDDDRYLDMLRKNMYLPNRYKIFSGKKDSAMMRNTLNAGYISKVNINYTTYYQFVYPLKVNDENWYLSGLLSGKNYMAKKQHVETWLKLLIGILLIFTLFSFQFIKLFLLSKSARIRTSDMVLICFSISGIACIVTLLVINLVTLSGLRMKTRENLGILSDSISSAFIGEMNLMYRATEDYEEIDHKLIPQRVHVLTDSGLLNKPDSMLSLRNYPFFKSLFLTDTGWTNNILTTWKQDIRSPIDYRKYFRFNDEWKLPQAQTSKRFRLESIYSNTSGDVMAVLARPSKYNSDTVYCISSIMYSVINTVLPPGFEFRIIGEDGHVWFHSDERKNNRDNFLDECNNHPEVKEALHNRVKVTLPLKISLVNYQAHISPIGTLPLYLVTMRDTRELNEFLSHINYILFIFIAIGIFCGLISTGIFFYEKHNKNSGYDHDKEPGLIWLLPDKQKNNRYIIIAGLNVLLGIFISIPVLFGNATIVHFLLILVSAYSFSSIYIYSLLKTVRRKAFKKSVLFTFSFLIVCCNLIYSILLPGFWLFFTFEILAIAIYGLVLFRVLGTKPDPGSGKDAHMPYVTFVFSWMFFACVLPTLILFRISANEEVELMTRKNQVELAREIEQKNSKIDNLYNAQIYPNNDPAGTVRIDSIKYSLKQLGNYLLTSSASMLDDTPKPKPDVDTGRYNKSFLSFNRHLRQMFRSDDIRSYHMLYGSGLDTMWSWKGGRFNRNSSDTLTLYYFAKQKGSNGSFTGYQLAVTSFLDKHNTGTGSTAVRARIFLPLLFFLLVLFLFLLVRSVVKFIFFLELPDGLNIVSGTASLSKNSRLFLINALNQDTIRNMHHAENATFAKESPREHTFQENTLLVLKPVPENIEQWKQLSRVLGEASEKSNIRIVILSHFTPVQLWEIIEEQINSASDLETKQFLIETRRKLINYLADFVVFYLEYNNPNVKLSSLLDNWLLKVPPAVKNEYKAFLEKEIKFADIPDIQNGNLPEIFTGENVFNRLVPKLFDLFALRYQRLWEQCTQNEKVILVDVAIDSLVNSKNKEDIRNLIGKGILEIDGKLLFTSQGFRRYVIGLSESSEFHNLENLSKNADGWNKIRNPLYIIFGAVVVFFFFTQQDVISGLYGAIISITGLIGALFRFGIFGRQAESTR